MAHFTASLLRRGAQLVQDDGDKQPELNIEIPTWALFIMMLTAIAYYAAIFKVRYTIGSVMGTIATVEESETSMVPETGVFKDDVDTKSTEPFLEQEVVVVKSRPVTSRIRSTMALLKSHGGRLAPFRGFTLYLAHAGLRSLLITVLATPIPWHLGRALAVIAAEVTLAPFQMAWVHVVITKPSSQPWYKRVPSGKWAKIAPAAFIRALAYQLATGISMAMLCLHPMAKKFAEDPSSHMDKQHMVQTVLAIINALTAGFATYILVCVPAHVTFNRVAASMLPEEEQTIVPFDRTFGGRVVPMALGGSGKIGMLDAWKTFSWEARRRFLGVMLKAGAIMVATTFLFFIAITAQAMAFTKTESRQALVKTLHI